MKTKPSWTLPTNHGRYGANRGNNISRKPAGPLNEGQHTDGSAIKVGN